MCVQVPMDVYKCVRHVYACTWIYMLVYARLKTLGHALNRFPCVWACTCGIGTYELVGVHIYTEEHM